MEIKIKKINEYSEDLAEVVKTSFIGEAVAATSRKNPTGDGYLDGCKLGEWMDSGDVYEITAEGTLIGGIVVYELTEEESVGGKLEKIFILPEEREKGFASSAFALLEQEYLNFDFWECEIPMMSRRDHGFLVEKCEFRVVKIQSAKQLKDSKYILRKVKPLVHPSEETASKK